MNPAPVRMEERVQMLVWVSAAPVPVAIQESSAAAVSRSVPVAHVRMEGLAVNSPREGSSASVNQSLLASPANIPAKTQVSLEWMWRQSICRITSHSQKLAIDQCINSKKS